MSRLDRVSFSSAVATSLMGIKADVASDSNAEWQGEPAQMLTEPDKPAPHK